MLELWKHPGVGRSSFNRRRLLRVGLLGLGGLTLADLLRLRSQAASNETAHGAQEFDGAAVIFIELAGGPSHFETYDPKPLSQQEFRGPLATVPTALAGVHFSQYMSRQAAIADRLAILRAVHHDSSSHQTSAHLVQTGYYLRDRQNTENEMPCAGAMAARVRGENTTGVPPFVAIPRAMRYGGAAYLGKGFNPFETAGDPAKGKFEVRNLTPIKGLDAERLDDRRELLSQLDAVRRLRDNRGVTEAVDEFGEQAFEIVTGRKAREAFDLSRESDAARQAYGKSSAGQSLLLARRLVEAGVTFVTVRVGGWDDHKQIAKGLRTRGPEYDQAVAALVDDLYQRGLDRQVLLVAMGEFGRTPRINRDAGRDHWGAVMSVLLSGGGLKVGQVVGASTAKGEAPADAPYRPEDVLATVYRHLGIDARQTFSDFGGRPRYVLERGAPVAELI